MTIPPHVDQHFQASALNNGSVDAAYAVIDSPVGPLLVATTDAGICAISFEGKFALDHLCERLGVRILFSEKALSKATDQLRDYFDGERWEFDLDVDLSGLSPFQLSVLTELRQIPYGSLSTYGSLAKRVGNPRAARAVGGALNRNPVPIIVPCHRVVGASGNLVGYTGGLERKRTLLGLEGSLS